MEKVKIRTRSQSEDFEGSGAFFPPNALLSSMFGNEILRMNRFIGMRRLSENEFLSSFEVTHSSNNNTQNLRSSTGSSVANPIDLSDDNLNGSNNRITNNNSNMNLFREPIFSGSM